MDTFLAELYVAAYNAIILAAFVILVVFSVCGCIVAGRYIGRPIGRAMIGFEYKPEVGPNSTTADGGVGKKQHTSKSYGNGICFTFFMLGLALELIHGVVAHTLDDIDGFTSLLGHVAIIAARACLEGLVVTASVSGMLILIEDIRRRIGI